MYLNEYNKVKSSTVTAGYDVGVTNMINFHPCGIKFNYTKITITIQNYREA